MAEAVRKAADAPRADEAVRRLADKPKRSKGPTGRPRGRPPLRRAAPGEDMPDDIRGAMARIKRDSIVAAAVELFYRQGYVGTTLDQVAEAMNASKPLIYSHFDSKAALLAEISSRAITIAHQALNRALATPGTSTERLRTIVREFLLAVLDHQAHAVIYSREETELKPEDRDRINGLRRDFDHKLTGVLQAGVDAGEFTIDDVALTALAIGGVVGWAPVWYRPSGRLAKEEAADKLTALVLHMVRAAPVKRKAAAKAKDTKDKQ